MVIDISETLKTNANRLNADDLLTGPIEVKITNVTVTKAKDGPVSVFHSFDKDKPFKPCLTMRKAMSILWGKDASVWIGRELTLFRDPTAPWKGEQVGGVRISHMSHISKVEKLSLTETRGKKQIITIKPMQTTDGNADTPDTTPEPDNTAALKAARDAAKKGSEVFRKWWTDNADMRDAAKTIMDELKETASKVDAAMVPNDDEVPM